MVEVHRRPNPPGWVPPKAPYNPYDYTDVRPAEGYPSEFEAPGRQSAWSSVPKDASAYKKVLERMRKLQYTPRPRLEIYPGQHKVLRRVNTYYHFNLGVKYATYVCCAIGLGAGLTSRWNSEGYENVFSDYYRWLLKVRRRWFGTLTQEQVHDLEHPGMVDDGRVLPSSTRAPEVRDRLDSGGDLFTVRPTVGQAVQAHGVIQDKEWERVMAEVGAADSAEPAAPAKKPWWRW